MKRPSGTVAARMAALLDAQRAARRSCRWMEWRNAQPAFCRQTGCAGGDACREPPHRHLPRCRYGGVQDAGCSEGCQAIADVLAEYARQPALWAETA